VKYKKPHHPTYSESNFYKRNSHRFTSSSDPSAWVTANNNLKNNGRKLAPDERGGQTNPFTRADGDAFFEPKVSANGTSSTPTQQQQYTTCTGTEKEVPQGPDLLLPELLKVEIQKRVNNPSYLMKKSKSCPLPVAAVVEYLLALTSFRYKEGTNVVMANDTRSKGVWHQVG
jgi:hypothetical protein